MKFTNRHGLPQALCDAVTNDPYDNGGAWRSVTQLIAPPRQVLLKKLHDHEIVEDVSERLYALYGQIVHAILERANTDDLVEDRLFTSECGRLISGGYDVLQLQKGKLIDWKFSTVWKAIGGVDEWIAQLNLLALLFRRKGIDIRELEIVLLMRDHSKPKARREENYPQLPVKRIPIPMWSALEQDTYLEKRVRLHMEAEDKLPLCSPPERWQKPSIYAVIKQGGTKAVRGGLCETKEEAEAMVRAGKDLEIQVRQGESTRCFDYCSAAPFCKQFLSELRGVPLVE
jgi:hypothetical protein